MSESRDLYFGNVMLSDAMYLLKELPINNRMLRRLWKESGSPPLVAQIISTDVLNLTNRQRVQWWEDGGSSRTDASCISRDKSIGMTHRERLAWVKRAKGV